MSGTVAQVADRTGIAKRVSGLLLLLFTISVAAWSAQSRRITLERFAPTQEEAGMAEVHEKADEFIAKAQRLAAQENRPFDQVILEVLNEAGREKELNSYVDPEGRYRPDDGHHSILAADEVIKRLGLDPSKVGWSVRVEKGSNFKAKNESELPAQWEKFGAKMEEEGLGRLSTAQAAESEARHETPGSVFNAFRKIFLG